MKKLTALVLALLLALSVSACGGNQPANSDQPAKTDSTAPAADVKKEKISLVIGAGHTAGSMEYIDSLDNFFKPETAKRVAENTNYDIEKNSSFPYKEQGLNMGCPFPKASSLSEDIPPLLLAFSRFGR